MFKAWKYHSFFMKVPEIINAPSLSDYDVVSAIIANISLYIFFHSFTAWHLNDWWTIDSWESNLWEFCYLTAFCIIQMLFVWDIFMVIDVCCTFIFGACARVAWLMRMIMRPIINGMDYIIPKIFKKVKKLIEMRWDEM